MKLDDAFKTKTMARILVEQGRVKEGIHVYAHLLRKNPGQRDIRVEIAALKSRINNTQEKGVRDLSPLYRQWVRLALKMHRDPGRRV